MYHVPQINVHFHFLIRNCKTGTLTFLIEDTTRRKINMAQPKRLKSERGAAKYKNIWLLGNGLCFENKLQKETFYCFPLLGISKQQQEDIAVSPQYWARAAASKVVEQQASPKISNFPFWFSQNQKTNSILRKGFEIENSLAVMSHLNGHNKGPFKRSFWFQHLWLKP